MLMENTNDTIGNRSRDLPVCSALPQPLRYRVPQVQQVHNAISLRIPTSYFLSHGIKYIQKYSLVEVNIHAVRGC
jgi:hypothetical protein